VVGGDFYDFFRLGDHRLGIFIAEGGNRGIASALNIALAKGFLMHTVRRGLAPHDIVMRLELALGTLICGVGASTYVAYAVVDTAAGRLWYARTGEYPKVLVSSRPVMERKIELPGSDKVVYEGGSDLRGGDTVLLVTDGIASKVRINGARAADQVLEALGRKRRSQELEDDLTAVVVRVERVGSAIGVVA
jgi:serine phosphatase RsbU (regulator of sigma subunit)